MSDNKKRQLKTFPGLKPEQFMHPWDIKATDGLASVPGLDKVVGKVMEYGLRASLLPAEHRRQRPRVGPTRCSRKPLPLPQMGLQDLGC